MDIVPALLKSPSDIFRVPDSTVKVVPLEVDELPLVLDKVKSFLRVKLPDVKDNLEIPTSDPPPADHQSAYSDQKLPANTHSSLNFLSIAFRHLRPLGLQLSCHHSRQAFRFEYVDASWAASLPDARSSCKPSSGRTSAFGIPETHGQIPVILS